MRLDQLFVLSGKLSHFLPQLLGPLLDLHLQRLIATSQRLQTIADTPITCSDYDAKIEEICPPCLPWRRLHPERHLERACHTPCVISSPYFENIFALGQIVIFGVVIGGPFGRVIFEALELRAIT